MIEVTVTYADYTQLRVARQQASRGFLGNTRSTAEEEERDPFRLSEARQLPSPVGVGDALRNTPTQDTSRQHHARPVAEHHRCRVKEGAQGGIAVAEVEGVDVDVQDRSVTPFADDL